MSSIRLKSKSLAPEMLSKGFKPAKCKTTLKLAVSRIKLLKNKREVAVKQMRRELAQLLESGQEQTARIRVEHVIREEKTMAAYDLIEIYCELIVVRMPIIEAHKSCPIDLKEPIASVIFASPRCADLPELMDVHKHFLAKYGKDFVNSALEVRPDCGVSRLVVEKLSARAPEVDIKLKTLAAIAQEHNIKWDPKSFEEELKKPKEDILDGPSTSVNTNWMPEQSTYMKHSRTSNENTESTKKKYDVSASSDISSGANTSIPIRSQSEPSVAGQGPTHQEFTSGSSASWNHPNWNVEFKDATSAAQAAVESAEKASLAARVAAELASRGTFSKPSSADMPGTSTYHSRSQEPEAPKDPKPSQLGTDMQESLEHWYKGDNSGHQDSGERSKNDIYNKRTSDNFKGGFVYDKFGKLSTDLGERSSPTANGHMKTEFEGDSDVFSDDYLSDKGADLDYATNKNENLLDRLSSRKGEKDVPTVDHWSRTQKQSVDEKVKSSGFPTMSIIQDMRDTERGEEDKIFLRSDEDRPIAFDDSDGPEYEIGDVSGNTAINLNSSLNLHKSFGRLSPTKSINGKEEIGDAKPFIPNAYRKSSGADLGFGRKSRDNVSGSGGEPPSPKSISSSKWMTYRTSMDPPSNPGSSKAWLREKSESKNRLDLESSPNRAIDSQQSDFGNDSDEALNLPKLRGGFRNKKGFLQPPYVKDPSLNASSLSRYTVDDAPFISDRPLASRTDNPLYFDFSHDDIYEPKTDSTFSKSSRTTRTSRADTHTSHTHDQSNRRGRNEHPSLSLNKENEKSAPVKQVASQDGKLSGEKLRGTFVEDEGVEDKEPLHSARSRTKDVKVSRRSRNNTVSGAKDDVLSASEDRSYPPHNSDIGIKASHTRSTAYEPPPRSGPGYVEGRKRFNALQEKSSVKKHNLAPSEAETTESSSTTRFGSLESLHQHPSVSAKFSLESNSKGSASGSEKQENVGSSEGLTSRENSLKSKSHVHPKLPDYDTLTAHFQQLRTNRRS